VVEHTHCIDAPVAIGVHDYLQHVAYEQLGALDENGRMVVVALGMVVVW